MKENIYICKGCGEIKNKTENLCAPVNMGEAHACGTCGKTAKLPDNLCKPERTNINYVCMSCGGVSDLPKKLCNPRDLEKLVKEEPPLTLF